MDTLPPLLEIVIKACELVCKCKCVLSEEEVYHFNQIPKNYRQGRAIKEFMGGQSCQNNSLDR